MEENQNAQQIGAIKAFVQKVGKINLHRENVYQYGIRSKDDYFGIYALLPKFAEIVECLNGNWQTSMELVPYEELPEPAIEYIHNLLFEPSPTKLIQEDIKETAMIGMVMGFLVMDELYEKYDVGSMTLYDIMGDWAVDFYHLHKDTNWEDVQDNPVSFGFSKDVMCWDDAVMEFAQKKAQALGWKLGPRAEAPQSVKYEHPRSADHKWVVAYDTLCEGWSATVNHLGQIRLFTMDEANQELEEYFKDRKEEIDLAKMDESPSEGDDHLQDVISEDELFIVHMDEYLHGRKLIMTMGDDGQMEGSTTGYKPAIE